MQPEEKQPIVYVIAGPNGAGKTTFAAEFLPTFVECREFLNADLIAAGLSPFAPETQNVKAGRLLLERLRELSAERKTFGFETTLSGRTYVKILRDLKQSGYRVELFFLWLPSVELAISRVAGRVRQGGHNVPVPDIRRRFSLGLNNLVCRYRRIADSFRLFRASIVPPELICDESDSQLTIHIPELFDRFTRMTAEVQND